MTFGQLLDKWYEKRIESRYRQTRNVEVYANFGKRELGNVQLSRLTTPMLVDKLQNYAGRSPVAANRCLGMWKLCLGYGVELGVIDRNPLDKTTIKAVGGEEKTRDRVLTDDEIRWIFGKDCRPLMRFLLLTGLRISEAQNGYCDGDKFRVERTKNGDPHWVHLTPLALDQLAKPFDRSPTAYQHWLKHTAKKTWTPHDLRRTFATRLAGLGIAPHIVEKCLNHRMQGVMAIYNRHGYEAERIAAAEAWSDELKRILEGGKHA
jgi:integrase